MYKNIGHVQFFKGFLKKIKLYTIDTNLKLYLNIVNTCIIHKKKKEKIFAYT